GVRCGWVTGRRDSITNPKCPKITHHHKIGIKRTAARCCPDGWVGYGGKCYYFSEAEGDWNNSQSNCSSFSASLAEIDTPQEMAFIKRHKDLSEHWIGLRREPGQVWKWTNGTEFNHWFKVRAQGECAYLNDEAVTSSWCDTVRYWICSKPAGLTLREQNGAQGQAEMSELSS
uniref:C-type lectin domain-containing protein n=1 Tax=Gopherus agassizii TaxID=38772 RepID=A0A452GLX4_9SAUR